MSEKIRVMQMFYSFDVESAGGGLSRFAIELGRKLDHTNFEVVFCSLGYHDSTLEKKWIADLREEGYEAFEATNWDLDKPYLSFLKAQHALNRRLSNQPVNILHSHSEFTDINAVWFKLSHPSLGILRTVHYGFTSEWRTKPLRRHVLSNFLYPLFFNLEVGINQFNTDRLNRRFVAKIIGKRARRLYNAIPLQQFQHPLAERRAKKRSLGIPSDSLVIGSIGRLVEQKGYTYLLDAVPILLQHRPDTYFLIVGDGPLLDEIKAKAALLRIDQNVIFTGARTDVEDLLRCMDLFVSSALWEGVPTVILEAMACGVPVVATDIVGTNELIHDHQNGRLAPSRDGVGLAHVILETLASPTDLNHFISQAQKDLKQFEIGYVAQEYENIYRSMVGRSHPLHQSPTRRCEA